MCEYFAATQMTSETVDFIWGTVTLLQNGPCAGSFVDFIPARYRAKAYILGLEEFGSNARKSRQKFKGWKKKKLRKREPFACIGHNLPAKTREKIDPLRALKATDIRSRGLVALFDRKVLKAENHALDYGEYLMNCSGFC